MDKTNKENPKNISQNQKKRRQSADLQDCLKKAQEYLEGWRRERADFENYKKRELERIERAVENSQFQMLLKILEIKDEIEWAQKSLSEMQGSENVEKLKVGLDQINSKLEKFLRDSNVEEINCQGEIFNPEFHEVVELQQTKDNSKQSGEIIKVFQKGYLFKGRLLRPARVKVVK